MPRAQDAEHAWHRMLSCARHDSAFARERGGVMTAQKESVVTAERFAQGISYEEWLKRIDRNQDKFVENYEGTRPNAEDVAAIKALMAKAGGPARSLALGEPWCPDVLRGLPAAGPRAPRVGGGGLPVTQRRSQRQQRAVADHPRGGERLIARAGPAPYARIAA